MSKHNRQQYLRNMSVLRKKGTAKSHGTLMAVKKHRGSRMTITSSAIWVSSTPIETYRALASEECTRPLSGSVGIGVRTPMTAEKIAAAIHALCDN